LSRSAVEQACWCWCPGLASNRPVLAPIICPNETEGEHFPPDIAQPDLNHDEEGAQVEHFNYLKVVDK